jgi:hypothetical protein
MLTGVECEECVFRACLAECMDKAGQCSGRGIIVPMCATYDTRVEEIGKVTDDKGEMHGCVRLFDESLVPGSEVIAQDGGGLEQQVLKEETCFSCHRPAESSKVVKRRLSLLLAKPLKTPVHSPALNGRTLVRDS